MSLRGCWAAVAATVLLQIAYPLLDGGGTERALTHVSITTVLTLGAAGLLHAAATLGRGAALVVLVVAGGIGLLAEAIGVHTGFPFGGYAYATSLGPTVLGVPLVVPAAWVMMAYPALLVGRRAAGPDRSHRRVVVAAVGAWTLAAWDVFLDPQLVAAGHWSFAHPAPGLPGIDGVPLTNLAGWLLTGAVLTAVLDAVLPRGEPALEAPIAVLLTWTWLGSALANAAFFDRPAVAAWGFVALGAPVAGYLAAVRRGPARSRVAT